MYNYIIPLIGDVKLDELTPRLMDKFYQSLLKVKTKVVQNKKPKNEYLTVHTVREIFNLCFRAGFVIDGFYEECFKTNKEIPMVTGTPKRFS